MGKKPQKTKKTLADGSAYFSQTFPKFHQKHFPKIYNVIDDCTLI